MNNIIKEAEIKRVSWDPNDPDASYWSTINPLSFLTGGVDKVPSWWMDKFPDKPVLGKMTGKELGHVTFKAGAVGLVTAGLIGATRLAMDADNLLHSKGTVVDASAKNRIGTTFDPDMYELDQYGRRKKKKQPQQQQPQDIEKTAADESKSLTSGKYTDLSTYNQLGFAVPAAATMLAAFLAYTASDEIASSARRSINEAQLKDRQEDLNNLMIQRARMAKGNLNELPEYKNPYTKTAAEQEDDGAFSSIKGFFKALGKGFSPAGNNGATWGALKAAALLATGAGSYMLFTKNNEENMKYKAYKNAITEYVKGKTNQTPLTVAPSNSDEMFETIDTKEEPPVAEETTAVAVPETKKKNPRNQPQFYSDELNTPISINI